MSAKLFTIVICLANTHALEFMPKALDVEYCMEGSDKWFNNINLNINPFPIVFESGAMLSLDVGQDVLQEIEVGSMLKLKMDLETLIGQIPIPCFPENVWI